MKRIATTSIALLAASPALAHPGHGGEATHWFSDVSHLAAIAGMVLAAYAVGLAIAAWRAKRR